MEERLALSNYLCNKEETALLKYLLMKNHLMDTAAITDDYDKKLATLQNHYPDFKPDNIFPYQHLLSNQIDRELFTHSFLVQPKLWIRIRKRYLKETQEELK